MQALKTAIRNQLLNAGISAVFDSQAPAAQALPYVLLLYVGGGYENQEKLDTRNELWQVKGIADDHAAAHTLAAQIHAALHGQALSISGWRHLWTTQTDQVWLVEQVAGVQVYHAGGVFRVRLHRAA